MTTQDGFEQARAEYGDEELDAVLSAANADILRHLQKSSDSMRLLATLFGVADSMDGESPEAVGGRDPNHSLVLPKPGTDSLAGRLIHARATASLIFELVNFSHQDVALMVRSSSGAEFTRLIVSEAVDKLNSAYDYAVHLAKNVNSMWEIDLDGSDIGYHTIETAKRIESVRSMAGKSLLDGDGYRADGFIQILGIELGLLSRQADHTRRTLERIPIDASGADLTGLGVQRPGLDWLIGVVWDQATHWPIILLERVADNSDEIQPGIYRIRGGAAHDPHIMATL
ncbi:hypothetical protein E1287_16745 [Actinomadura sp. KC06]|uniref:hypothetical protein n=1 Tax=Actinomadura sp. KC06 TaxID=2530369 RepID=UPI001044141E|nr:hypothetical protein [Actinomadura sp. KC06]TDD34401.1 hypothetical protein E1287_16745 [Actinomadura sp. KC06]